MESNNNKNKNTENVKFLCSYGGKILPRYTDGTLHYAGSLTRVSPSIALFLSQLMVKLGEFCGSSVNLWCQLSIGDLETLILITSDEDLANVIKEYDRASSSMNNRPLKNRAVLSPPKSLKQVSPLQTPPELSRNTPSYRFTPQTYSPPVGYSVNAWNCCWKSYPYSCQVQEYPRVSKINTP